MTTQERQRFEVTACVLLHRDERWLLSLRRADVAYAPNTIGLVGGHQELDPGPGALERTARREVREETGLDLDGVTLHYLESLQYRGGSGAPSVDVTFVAEVGAQAEASLGAPEELVELRWCTVEEARADPRCPEWLPDLLRRAEQRLSRVISR